MFGVIMTQTILQGEQAQTTQRMALNAEHGNQANGKIFHRTSRFSSILAQPFFLFVIGNIQRAKIPSWLHTQPEKTE